MTSALQKQDDGTIKLTVTIPSSVVQKTWDGVVDEMAKDATLPGFRKGKAPKKLVEQKLDRGKIQEEVLKKLLPKHYIDAVKEHNLAPILNPRIHLSKLENGKDLQFEAQTCEAPKVKLNDYRASIQKVTAKAKILVPGKEPTPPSLDEIVKALLETVTVTIPAILVEQEVERMLSHLLDDVRKLGLTLDQYLSSTGKTAENLRAEYEAKAKSDLSLEFVIRAIAEEEKITVEEKELNEAIQKAKDEKERAHLEQNRYLLASILRQQKTLDFLKNL